MLFCGSYGRPPESSSRRASIRRRPSSVHPPIVGAQPTADRLQVGACRAAELCDGLGLGLVLAAFARGCADREPGDLGQQVTPISRHLAQFRRARVCLRIVQRTPPGETPGRAREPCDENPVSLRTVIDHAFEYHRCSLASRRPGLGLHLGPVPAECVRCRAALTGRRSYRLRQSLVPPILPGTTPTEDIQEMPNERQIREQIIGQLTNVYTHTPDLEEEAEPQALWVDPDKPEWTAAEMEMAYTVVMAMFLYYAMEVEARGGPGLLEHLQRQAVVNALDDEPPAAS